MIENLNKESFFNEMHEKFPEAIEHFYMWFHEYKKEVGWDDLFGNHTLLVGYTSFEHLPFEMQNGILARFELELYHNKPGIVKGVDVFPHIAEEYKGRARSMFADLQKQILKLQKKRG